MSTQTALGHEEPIPKFESTLVIAFPDVLQAGPKILLSAASAGTNGASVASWIHYFKKQSTSRKDKSSKATSDDQKIRHSTTTLSDQKGVSLLTIVVAPPTTEQVSHLCEAIVNRARASGTSKIILVAASNFATKDSRTHVLKLHHVDNSVRSKDCHTHHVFGPFCSGYPCLDESVTYLVPVSVHHSDEQCEST
ncbi:hypothetical protein B0O80DRAFT_491871 [Mortierella sp. GBAus27b]|nr:hypothetical protein B0O80DRAFT_491871 [Mortierella sp. GBAus27b]